VRLALPTEPTNMSPIGVTEKRGRARLTFRTRSEKGTVQSAHLGLGKPKGQKDNQLCENGKKEIDGRGWQIVFPTLLRERLWTATFFTKEPWEAPGKTTQGVGKEPDEEKETMLNNLGNLPQERQGKSKGWAKQYEKGER